MPTVSIRHIQTHSSTSRHPAQRRCPPPSRHANANSASPIPSVQRSADAHNPPVKQTQTQPLQSSSEALTTHNLSVKRHFFLAGCTSRGRGCCLALLLQEGSQTASPSTASGPSGHPSAQKKETPPFQCLPSGIVYSFLIYISVNNFSLSGSSPLNNSRNKIITGSYPCILASCPIRK